MTLIGETDGSCDSGGVRTLAALLVLGLSVPAFADGDPAWEYDKPVREAARVHFERGQALEQTGDYYEAECAYRRAVELWPDHPKVHLGLASTLLARGKPLAARDHLVKAKRYGPTALGWASYRRALELEKLIGQRLAVLDVQAERGARVTVDGVAFSQRVHLLPGRYKVVVSKSGARTSVQWVVLKPGQRKVLHPLLMSSDRRDRLTETPDRTRGGVAPWRTAIAGAGLVATIAGLALGFAQTDSRANAAGWGIFAGGLATTTAGFGLVVAEL